MPGSIIYTAQMGSPDSKFALLHWKEEPWASSVAQKERCWSLRRVKAKGIGGGGFCKMVQMHDGEPDQAWLPSGHQAEADSVTSARPVRTPCPATGMQRQQPCFDFFFLFRNGLLSHPTYAFSTGLAEGEMKASAGGFPDFCGFSSRSGCEST